MKRKCSAHEIAQRQPFLQLRPHILLILIRRPHSFDDFLSLGLWKTALLGNNLAKQGVDFACHVRRVTADIEVSLLLEEFVNLRGGFLQLVLNIDLLGSLARKGYMKFEVLAQILFVLLKYWSADV
jgi:hypothetical protein